MKLYEGPLRELLESFAYALAGFAMLAGSLGLGYVIACLIKMIGGTA